MTRARVGLGGRIKRLRDLSGLSARELSALAGMHHSHVSLVETTDAVSVDRAVDLSNVLNVSLDWMLKGVGPEPTVEQLQAAVSRARRRRDRLEKHNGTTW